MKLRFIKLFVASVVVFVIQACDKGYNADDMYGNSATICLSMYGMSGGNGTDYENAIHTISGFRFMDGILKERFDNMTLGADGTIEIDFAEKKGNLVLWANAAEIIENASFKVGVTTESEFMSYTAKSDMMNSGGLTMTASVILDGTGKEILVRLKRSVARIDLNSEFDGVEVKKIVIRGISDTGYVNDVERELQSPDKQELVKDFGNGMVSTGTQTLFYTAAQTGGQFEVEADVVINGAWKKMRSVLDKIGRNTIYTVRIYGNGSTSGITVSEGDWEMGSDVSSGQIYNGLIDTQESVFSDGVRTNLTKDTLYIPYIGCDMTLALDAGYASYVEIKGYIDGVVIQEVEHGASSENHVFNISAAHRFPGKSIEYMYMDILSESTMVGRIVIVAEANPVVLTGKIKFDDSGICDFNGYVDGELGLIRLPEGKTLELRFPAGEKEWMRVVPVDGNSYRIEGGWKPNDPEADGRVQNVNMVVVGESGEDEDTYVIRRRNWGLPVVNINGTWWCKYNLRGNVKNFEDQITMASEPSGVSDLAEYLRTCPDEEFLRLAGDQYQAGRQIGMPVKVNGNAFVYDGYDSSHKMDFGSEDPESMAPDGYMVPDYQNYRFFTWGENVNLGYGSNAFNNQLGQRLSFTIYERNVNISGVDYGTVHIYDYEYDGTHWIMYGLGHQYDSTRISPMSIIFATYGRNGKSWMLEGYMRTGDGRGNWYKYVSHNPNKTRIIRCVKTPVDYIYK